MMRKNRGAAIVAALMLVSVAGPSAVYAEEGHELVEFKVIPPTCTEKGYSIYRCKGDGCNYEEKRDETAPLGHDMKEVSVQEATPDKPGVITYKCQRPGCDYTELSDVPYKDSADSEAEDDKTSESQDDPNKKPENDLDHKAEDGMNENADNSDSEKKPDAESNTSAEDKNTTSTEENSSADQTEELPEEDIDEEYASFASATSTDIVTEYDPETAAGTIRIETKDSDGKNKTEEIAGMTVPAGTTEIKKDADGNITDLAVSTEIEELKNGFSLTSENKKLHSVSIISKEDPENYWITLKAKESASELGIRLHTGDNKIIITLTENEKSLNIINISDTEKELILTTSTGGTCVINKNIQKFSVDKNIKTLGKKNQIILNDVNGNKPYLELAHVEDKNNSDEELYWIQPYGDESQEPVVITVYKN